MAFSLLNIKEALKQVATTSSGVVGVDIGSSSIKMVQLKKTGGLPSLETYGELQLGPYGGIEIGRATELDQKKMREALTDIIREASITSKNAAVAISTAASLVSVIPLPKVDESQLPAVIPVEARKYIPVPITEVTLDWFVIPNKDESESKVLLAAINTEALSSQRELVREVGLLSSFNEIEIFSAIRSSALKDDTLVMILDLGAATTKLYVVNSGMVERTHTINLGAQDLTQVLADQLSLTVEKAEEVKRQTGLTGMGSGERIRQILIAELDKIFSEARVVLDRHRSSGSPEVSKIILTGGGATLMGLGQYASGAFSNPVVVADPFSKIEYPAFLEETLKSVGPTFSVAIGVALRHLNQQK